jgi:hypothetical protein
MPYYTGFAIVGFFASLDLPGLNGFISEFFVFQGAFQSEGFWAGNSIVYGMPRWIVYAALPGIVLTAGYILWTIQRVFLFGKVTDHHYLEFKDLSARRDLDPPPVRVPLRVSRRAAAGSSMGYMDGSLKAFSDLRDHQGLVRGTSMGGFLHSSRRDDQARFRAFSPKPCCPSRFARCFSTTCA